MSNEGSSSNYSNIDEVREDIIDGDGRAWENVSVTRLVLYAIGAVLLAFAEALAGLVSAPLRQIEAIIAIIGRGLEHLVEMWVWAVVDPLMGAFQSLQAFLGDFGLLAFPISVITVIAVLWLLQLVLSMFRRVL